MTKQEILDAIEQMSVMDLAELVEELEEKFGVSAAAPVAMAPGAGAGAEVEEEEQTEFDVVLTEIGDQKIKVIKAVREVTDLGLKEAKALVDEAPNNVKDAVSQEEADEVKEKLEEVGATVEIR